MTEFFSEHARARAIERYGIELSAHDMAEILRATKDGRAQLMQNTSGGRIFVWRIRGRTILPALDAERDYIVSFMPADYFLRSSRREHKSEVGMMRIGKRRRTARGNRYRRERGRPEMAED